MHIISFQIQIPTTHLIMESLSDRLESYSTVMDILDGIRTLPNVNEEYTSLLNVVRQVHKEIESLQSSLINSRLLIDKLKNQVDGL